MYNMIASTEFEKLLSPTRVYLCNIKLIIVHIILSIILYNYNITHIPSVCFLKRRLKKSWRNFTAKIVIYALVSMR